MSLEVLFRQASTCQAASLSATALEQTLKEKQGRYRCISFQYNVVDFSVICLKRHPFFVLTLDFLFLILCSLSTLSQHNAKNDMHFIIPGI